MISPVPNCLPDPPVGVSAESIPTGGIKALDGSNQPLIGRLHKVINAVILGQAVAMLSDIRHGKAQVRSDKPLVGSLAATPKPWRAAIWAIWMIQPSLNLIPQLNLLRRCEQRDATNLIKPP
jgi:hypothetical protein